MSLSIPKEQKHGVETPVMLPFYQYVKLSPVGSKSSYTLKNDNYSDEIKWELSGDNIINLAKSYIQYDIVCEETVALAANVGWTLDTGGPGTGDGTVYPNIIGGIKEGFGIASFRICNQTGTDLVRLDDSYELYRIWMDEIVRKKNDQYYQDNYYDGITLKWDNNLHEKRVQDVNEWEMPVDGDEVVKEDTQKLWQVRQHKKGPFILHVKIPLGRFYNTFAAMKSDVFFAERMYIIIKLQTLDKFGPMYSYADKQIYQVNPKFTKEKYVPVLQHRYQVLAHVPVKFTIENMRFYAYYNKDSQCNNNTKNFCLSKPLQFNDFRCHQVSAKSTNGLFNYSFTLNSSNGPFLRFIVYRQWDNTDSCWVPIPYCAKFRWMINDFVHQPDYAQMQYYDSYMMVQDYFKDSWYDVFRQDKSFNEKFFEILNFGSRDIDNIKNQAGRPLASDLKITFEIDCSGDEDWKKKDISHRFYIITGRLCTINGSGIVSVV